MRYSLLSLLVLVSFFSAFYSCGKNQNEVEPLHYDLIKIAESENLWTGIAVSKEERIFVNYPRWSPDVPFSVGELTEEGGSIPYPDAEWNKWDSSLSPEDHFVCVQSVYVDSENSLWVLDPANPFLRGVVEDGPKLLKIDLNTNQVVQKIVFDDVLAPTHSYLNDVRINTSSGYAYITDSGTGAILVVNLNTEKSRRVLVGHTSTMAEDIVLKIAGNEFPLKVHADGIALDLKREYVYYQALTGRNMYRIKTEFLNDSSLTESQLEEMIEHVCASGASDGLAYKDGYVYITAIEHNAIKRIAPEGVVHTIVQDPLLEWPDSLCVSADGDLYVTTSRIGFPPGTVPYRIFKLCPQ